MFICAHCGSDGSSEDKKARFCSRSCAAKTNNKGRKRTDKSKRKVSAAVRKTLGLPVALAAFERPKQLRRARPRTAPLNPEGTAHRYGPYHHKKTGYLYFVDIYADGSTKKVQQHREVYKSENGQLTAEDVVHHNNEVKIDNDPQNLVAMAVAAHSRLHARKGRSMVRLCCPTCEGVFTRRRGVTQLVDSRKWRGTFCSRKCGRNFHTIKPAVQEARLADNVIEEFRE